MCKACKDYRVRTPADESFNWARCEDCKKVVCSDHFKDTEVRVPRTRKNITKEQIIEIFTGKVTNPLDIAECAQFWRKVMDDYGGEFHKANEDTVDKFVAYADAYDE